MLLMLTISTLLRRSWLMLLPTMMSPQLLGCMEVSSSMVVDTSTTPSSGRTYAQVDLVTQQDHWLTQSREILVVLV